MKRPNLDACILARSLSGLILIFCTTFATGSELKNEITKQDPRLVTVEELMQLDAQAALRLARRHQFDNPPGMSSRASAEMSSSNSSAQSAKPVVQAIYGIGRALTAEVQLGQEVHVLGQRNHRVSGGGNDSLTLERIDPPCVHIKRDQQKEILCLQQVRP